MSMKNARKQNQKNLIVSIFLFLTLSEVSLAEDNPTALELIAATCFSCHGYQGRSITAIPSIAGYEYDNMVAIMKNMKTNISDYTIMNRIAKGYDDYTIASLAKYFSEQ